MERRETDETERDAMPDRKQNESDMTMMSGTSNGTVATG